MDGRVRPEWSPLNSQTTELYGGTTQWWRSRSTITIPEVDQRMSLQLGLESVYCKANPSGTGW